MHFKSWDDIDPPPNEAEQKLKAAAEAGEICILGPHDQIPEEPDDWSALTDAQETRHIRAEVLRLLLLNREGCDVTEEGVMLYGAYVSGPLALFNGTIPGNMLLHGCRFQHEIFASRSKWAGNLRLRTCALPALSADGATLQGQLDCEGATFDSPDGVALNLQNAQVKDHLFLRKATVNGTADLIGAKIGGQLDCEGATFNTPQGTALDLQGAEITGGLILRALAKIDGILDLNCAKTSTLVDDPQCWPAAGKLILNGFTYDRVHGPADTKTRLDWLAKGDRWEGEFYPQPYKQLAKTLHDIGHEAAAQEVRYVLATKLAAERKADIRKQIKDAGRDAPKIGLAIGRRLRLGAEHLADFLLRSTVGYGRKPFRSLHWLIGLIASCWIVTLGAWHRGDFAPNSAPILRSAEWRALTNHPNAAEHWAQTSPTGRDWESFSSLAYAADIVIPIVDFGQTEAWAPSTERGSWGYHLWWLRWLFTTLGWIVSALGAAALTGIIRRE
ncbi:hypothetical protein [Phaeobacter sp. HF9A]|uniref:hypothetical protein n=1 Tax=Phaeobacter sp. HF9A TaxID=2721561 RepID=UPI001432083E|nr:hypothetical protein [Phaeobacter sp. HF9A]NIZ14566.1 hypothetical protein [Phaeobacter sp. HF9A]